MKNSFTPCMRFCIKQIHKLLLAMILALLYIVAGTTQVSAKTNSHSSELNFLFEDVSIEEILNEIEKQSDYMFLYPDETIENKRITIDARNASLEEVMNMTLAGVNVEYTVLENNLVVIQPTGNNSAQGITVSGKVVAVADQIPLPGVNVFEKGTQNGTITDIDGNYTLTVTGAASILVFSYVGFLAEEIPVGDQQEINISLAEDILNLEEVVVVGYGTMKRSDLTGAVASVSEETLRSSVATNLDQALQGRIAGVQITQNSGQPGGAASVRIRGASSITGSSEPLYVIDGIPFQGDGVQTAGFDWSGGANGQSRVNPLSTINPNDIVNIEVLKDASASAIYGSRAANGVVLITTKRGSEGESKLSYNTFYALQSVPKTIEMMDLPNFAEYQLQIADELNQTPNERYLDPTILGPGTDWQDEVFENAWIQSHQISVTGGTAKTVYAVTGGYYDQDGIIIGSNFKRFTGRINLDSEVKEWLKVGASLSYAKTNEKITLNDGGDGVIMNALLMQPDIPVKNLDGEYAGPDVGYSGANYNPVALALLRNNTLERERLMGNIYGDAEIIKGLTFRTELGIDNNNSINKAFHPTYQFGAITNDLNKMRQRDENSFFWIWKNYLTYTNTLGEKHNINAVLGYESQKSSWQGTDVTKENFASNDIHVLSEGENTTSRTNGWKGSSSLVSFFGRVNYNFDNRYLATVTLRRDGSSKFGPNNKWGNFPSASVAWRISNESFMQGVSAIRNLKIRLGFGIIGNQAIGDYLYGSSLLSLDSPFGTAYRYEKIPNPDLKWEGTQMYNIGLDLSLFNGRIDFVAEVYKKKTEDMLLQLSIPSYLGGTSWEDIKSPYVNIGSMENKGVEFTLTTHNLKTNKLTWVTDLTMSFNRNKVLALDDPSTRYWENLNWYSEFQTATMTKVDEPLGVFYGYQTDGIFQNQEEILAAPVQIVDPESVTEENPNGTNLADYTTGVWIGDYKFKDLNGDGVINTEDQTVIGDPNPDFTYGFNNVFSYGPVELTIYLQGSYGAEILNYARVQIEGMTSPYSNRAMTVTDRSRYALIDPEGDPDDPANVTLANPGTDMPRFATNDNNRNNRMSDRFIENGTYLRIQNVSLAYTFPRDLTRKVKINRLRIYVNGQNLYTFTKYSGYDPEIGAFDQNARKQNIDMGRYPSPRMITFGLDIDF